MTVAAFMDLALYHPELGYYARADQRSGRAGDFFTSVDVGPLFGELLEIQLAEIASILQATTEVAENAERIHHNSARSARSAVAFDLVEAGAGNGRLSADILRAARERDRAFYDTIQLHLVEASAGARAAQRATLADVAERLASSDASFPCSFDGVVIANELLDALPVHQVVMREEGLRETYVISQRRSVLDTPERHGARASASDSLEPLRGAGAEQQRRGWGPGAVPDGGAPRDDKTMTARDIATYAHAGEPVASAALARYEERMARALGSVINVVDPQVIVLGGGLSNIDRLYESVPKLWAPYVFSDTVTTRLVRAAHGDSSGVRGAAWLWD